MMMMTSGGHMGWLVADLKKTPVFTEAGTRTASFYFLRKGNVMDDEIVMNDKDLSQIVVPSFSPPFNLNDDAKSVEPLMITGLVNADEELMKWLLFNGISTHAIGQNKMMFITSIDDITSGRGSYSDTIIKVRMKMGELNTIVSIELSNEQLEEIVRIGLRTQFGANVESVKVISLYHGLKKYDLEVTFKGRG